MKQIVPLLQVAALGLAMASGAGCGSKSQPAPEKPGLKIAMIAKSSTNPVFRSARAGAEAAAKELRQRTGVVIEIAWLTPEMEDGQVQAQRIAQAVSEGANAVLISCSDASKVTAAINDAVAHNVPVMTFDSDAPESKRFAFMSIDDVKAGERVMRGAGRADRRCRAALRCSPATRTRRTFASASRECMEGGQGASQDQDRRHVLPRRNA